MELLVSLAQITHIITRLLTNVSLVLKDTILSNRQKNVFNALQIQSSIPLHNLVLVKSDHFGTALIV